MSWPAVTRDATRATRAVLRALAPSPALPDDLLGARWTRLLGDALHASPGVPCSVDRASLAGRLAWVAVYEHPDAGVVLALLDRPLAGRLAAIALGSPDGAARAVDPAVEGALAAVFVRAARVATAPSPPPVLRAVTDRVDEALDALGARAGESLFTWPWTVRTRDDAGLCTLVLRAPWALRRPTLAGALARVGDVRVGVSLLGGRAWLASSTVAALSRGDVLTLDGLSRAPWGVAGDVTLVPGMPHDVGLTATLAEARAARLTSVVAPLDFPQTDDASMDSDEQALTTDALGALPVEVTVELAHARFSVAELAAWRVGEVVVFPQAVGDVALVRAGGRAVARGELVDVEGVVGVRVVEVL